MKPLMHILIVSMIAHTTYMPVAFAQQNEELDRLFEDDPEEEPPIAQPAIPPMARPEAPPGTFQPPPPTDPSSAAFPPPAAGNMGRGLPGSKKPLPVVKAQVGGKKPLTSLSGKVPISQAQIEDITNENYPDLIESFDYPNAEVTDVIKAISELTGKNFIIDPGVRGKISIIAPSQITVAEAWKAFLSALAINGFAVVPSGKFLKVKTARNAQRDSIETYTGAYYPNSDMMITRIVHLKYISAEEVNKRLRILTSKDGELTPYEPTNTLIITDYGANMERIMKILADIDKPGFEEQMEVMLVKNAKSKDLADLINQIINKEPTRGGAAGGGAFGAGVPRFRSRGPGTPGGGSPEELSLVVGDDRTNAIIVVGNRAGVEKVRDLLKKLDYKIDPALGGGVNVYYVKYGEAEKIATTFTGITGASSGAGGGGAGGGSTGFPPGGAPGRPFIAPSERTAIFGGDVRVTADKTTNSLVITASKQDYETVLALLGKIDIPRDQVFVEGIIMEMASKRNRLWNPTVYYLDPSSNGIGRSGFTKGDLQGLLNPAGDAGAILGFGGGAKVKMTLPGQTAGIEITSLLGFLKILQTTQQTNILSTPQILALDNEEAEIEVGDNIPIAADTSTGANGISTQSTRFEKATIKLKITPFISPDSNAVRMKIEQSVKQPTQVLDLAAKLKESATVISDRSIKTNIVVNSGDTAVLGGLVRDQESLDETKIPILGDIPILGWLFKSQGRSRDKVNLTVFLTPKIIRNVQDAHGNLDHRLGDRIDWIKQNFDGIDPNGKKIDSFPRAEFNADDDKHRSNKTKE